MSVEAADHYATLGVDHDATPEQIKSAYRVLIRQHHPDVAGPAGASVSAELGTAYRVLSDQDRRHTYDQELAGVSDSENSDEPFVDTWGEDATWDPGPEPASQPGREDQEPQEHPGQEWDQEEVLEDVVVEDPGPATPDPTPGSPPEDPRHPGAEGPRAKEPGESTGQRKPRPTPPEERTWPQEEYPPPRFVYPAKNGRVALILGALLLTLTVVLVWRAPATADLATLGAKGTILSAGITLGIITGVVLTSQRGKNPRTTSPRSVSAARTWGTWAVGALATAALWVLVPADLAVFALGGIALVVAVCATTVWTDAARAQKALDTVVSMGTLKQSTLFGTLPGGVAADVLDRDLRVFLEMPAVRVMRTQQEGRPFTHVLIAGHRVAFVRAVMAPPGTYRWSGPSLLRDQDGQYPQEVMSGPYDEATRGVRATLGRRVQVDTWLFVYTSPDDPSGMVRSVPDGDMPTVLGPEEGVRQVGQFLVAAQDMVDHRVVVDAAEALRQ